MHARDIIAGHLLAVDQNQNCLDASRSKLTTGGCKEKICTTLRAGSNLPCKGFVDVSV